MITGIEVRVQGVETAITPQEQGANIRYILHDVRLDETRIGFKTVDGHGGPAMYYNLRVENDELVLVRVG